MATKVKMMGKPELAAIKLLLEELDLTHLNPEDILAQTKTRKAECFPQAKLLPGIESHTELCELVQECCIHERG